MGNELVHTSAPRGLKPGTRGFCTVAATDKIPRQFTMTLESLSGYSFHYNLSDPDLHLSPVNYAHTIATIGSHTHHILSRVAFAGVDYSRRSNKIAHHFLLSAHECLPNGPAWMIAQMAEDIFVAEWEGEPAYLPERDLNELLGSQPALTPRPARHWQARSGDAGWAGALVKAFHERPNLPAYVLFEPGMDILPLFEESLALLAPEEKWGVAFTTYYTGTRTGHHYHWRAVIAGSAAAEEIARLPHPTVIDLTHPPDRAPDTVYTDAGRLGRIVRAPRPAAAALPPEAAAREQVAASSPLADAVYQAARAGVPQQEAAVGTAEPAGALAGADRYGSGRAADAALRAAREMRAWAKGLGIAVIGFALLSLIMLVSLSNTRGQLRAARQKLSDLENQVAKYKSLYGQALEKATSQRHIVRPTPGTGTTPSTQGPSPEDISRERARIEAALKKCDPPTPAKLLEARKLLDRLKSDRPDIHNRREIQQLETQYNKLETKRQTTFEELMTQLGKQLQAFQKGKATKSTSIEKLLADAAPLAKPGEQTRRVDQAQRAYESAVDQRRSLEERELLDLAKLQDKLRRQGKLKPKESLKAKPCTPIKGMDTNEEVVFGVGQSTIFVQPPKPMAEHLKLRLDRDGRTLLVDHLSAAGDWAELVNGTLDPRRQQFTWRVKSPRTASKYKDRLDFLVVQVVDPATATLYRCMRPRPRPGPIGTLVLECKEIGPGGKRAFVSNPKALPIAYPWPGALCLRHEELTGGETRPLAIQGPPKGTGKRTVRLTQDVLTAPPRPPARPSTTPVDLALDFEIVTLRAERELRVSLRSDSLQKLAEELPKVVRAYHRADADRRLWADKVRYRREKLTELEKLKPPPRPKAKKAPKPPKELQDALDAQRREVGKAQATLEKYQAEGSQLQKRKAAIDYVLAKSMPEAFKTLKSVEILDAWGEHVMSVQLKYKAYSVK